MNVKLVGVVLGRSPALQGLDRKQTGGYKIVAMPSFLVAGSGSAFVQIGAPTIRHIPEDVERDGYADGPAAPVERAAGALRRQSDSFRWDRNPLSSFDFGSRLPVLSGPFHRRWPGHAGEPELGEDRAKPWKPTARLSSSLPKRFHLEAGFAGHLWESA